MNKSTFEKIKKMFNQENLWCTFDLNKKTITVEISEGLKSAKSDALLEARVEVKRLIKSFKLTEESLEIIVADTLVANTVEFTALELKNAFSKSKLEGLMEVTERGLEVNTQDFGIPLKARYKREMNANAEIYRNTLRKIVEKGLIEEAFSDELVMNDDGMFFFLKFV